MSDAIASEAIQKAVLNVLTETFEKGYRYYTEEGGTILETLETVSAEEASRAASPLVGTLAAQVFHTAFYLEDSIRGATGADGGEETDWAGSWSLTTVTEAEWDDLRQNLRTQYGRTQELIRGVPAWNEDTLSFVIAIVAHSAYHLGEIRQALGVIRA